MKSRTLSRPGIKLSEIGLGCWQLGGGFGPMEEATAFAILEKAVREGITFFDTADAYGDGQSERLIGRFLAQSAKKNLVVGTKVGRGAGLISSGYTRDSVRTSIERSRERLGVPAIDLIQLHCVPTAVLTDGAIFDWLREFQAEGLVRSFGASVETIEEGHLCLRQEGIASLQVIVNMLRQKCVTELFPYALDAGVGIIARLPLASGLLAGKFSSDTTFAPTDHRHFNRDGDAFNVGETFAGLPFEKGVELADRLKPHVPRGYTMAQWAQRWILDHAAVTTLITGASTPAQVKENARVSKLDRLSAEDDRHLITFYKDAVAPHIRGPY